jgi:hypothetical protein
VAGGSMITKAIQTDLVSPRSRPSESDALIVKAYAMSASATRLVIPIGGVLSATDESRMR